MAPCCPVTASALDAAGQPWAVPTKNTFIHFDLPVLPPARLRSRTCPPLLHAHISDNVDVAWEAAHVEAPVHSRQAPEHTQADTISQVSTTYREENLEEVAPAIPVQAWTLVRSRRKSKASTAPVVPNPAPAITRLPYREGPSSRQRSEATGKGLSYFMRLEVGMEDDCDFRVVQRLIGPRGMHMKDILYQAKDAQIWITGKGTRSWETDTGPLRVCIRAPTENSFNIARGLVQDLLTRVHDAKRAFRR